MPERVIESLGVMGWGVGWGWEIVPPPSSPSSSSSPLPPPLPQNGCFCLETVYLRIIFSYFRRIFGKNNPTIGLLDSYSDGKCDHSTLVNSLFVLAMKCLHSESMRSTLEGSHKLESQSMSRSTSDNIGRSTKFCELLVPQMIIVLQMPAVQCPGCLRRLLGSQTDPFFFKSQPCGAQAASGGSLGPKSDPVFSKNPSQRLPRPSQICPKASQGSPMAPGPPEAIFWGHFPSQVAESDGRVAKN